MRKKRTKRNRQRALRRQWMPDMRQRLRALSGWDYQLTLQDLEQQTPYPGNDAFLSCICPSLYLGSVEAAEDSDYLRAYDIGAVLRIMSTPPDDATCQLYDMLDIHWLHLQLNGVSSELPIDAHLMPSYHFIDQQLEAGRHVLVHCAAGCHRSPTLVWHFLVRYLTQHDPVAKRAFHLCDRVLLAIQKQRRRADPPKFYHASVYQSFENMFVNGIEKTL